MMLTVYFLAIVFFAAPGEYRPVLLSGHTTMEDCRKAGVGAVNQYGEDLKSPENQALGAAIVCLTPKAMD